MACGSRRMVQRFVKVVFSEAAEPKPRGFQNHRAILLYKGRRQNKRAANFKKAAAKRYEACGDLRRHPDLNRGIEILQTSASPLGYGAERIG